MVGVFEAVSQRIAGLATTPAGLLEQLLRRVEEAQHSIVFQQVTFTPPLFTYPNAVQALLMLACTYNGMSETELMTLLEPGTPEKRER